MQTCLEYVSMNARHEQEARSDYQRNNQYSVTHPDALASSGNGKGTGHGGHSHWLPNCRGSLGVINYSNFDTAYDSKAGADCDVAMRERATSRSLYTPKKDYSLKHIDTSRNVKEGQFVNVFHHKTARRCLM